MPIDWKTRIQSVKRTRAVWALDGEANMPPDERTDIKTGPRINNKTKRTHPAALKARTMQSAQEMTEATRYFRLTFLALIPPITEKLQFSLEVFLRKDKKTGWNSSRYNDLKISKYFSASSCLCQCNCRGDDDVFCAASSREV